MPSANFSSKPMLLSASWRHWISIRWKQYATQGASFFFGARIWLGTILGPFSINYFSGLGLRVWVRIWVSVGVRVSVVIYYGPYYGQGKFRVRVRIRVRVGFGLWL